MIQRFKDWLSEKEASLTETQRLRYMIGWYVLIILVCAFLIYKTWATIPFVFHL